MRGECRKREGGRWWRCSGSEAGGLELRAGRSGWNLLWRGGGEGGSTAGGSAAHPLSLDSCCMAV